MAPANLRSTARNTKPKSKRKFSNGVVPPGLHYLPPLDPRSGEFAELFRSFLSSKDERKNILDLPEPDARLFIEIIDRAFRAAELDTQLRTLALSVLRRLCSRIGHLPISYLLSDKYHVSESPRASGGFADVRMGVFKGKDVAVKSLRVSEMDDKVKIRKRFCKEVAMWKNLSHPNVLSLIGIPDTFEDGKFSMVCEWMANGNIMEYVRGNSGNHLKLLADVAEGLKYLHNANIVHGDLKGANILITNTIPVSACLADFGFMTIVHDPSLEMESSSSEAGRGTAPFMAPELLVPSKFNLDKSTPTKEADVYAMGMVIYQVLTGTLPFGKISGSEVVFKVLMGGRPSKPANAPKLGLSDDIWELLEGCWETERTSRPSVEGVLTRAKAAALVCGVLSPVGDVPYRYEEPDSDFSKFDQLFALPSDDEEHGVIAMGRRSPSQDSTLTDSSLPDSLFSKLSEAESHITEPPVTSTDALAPVSCSKGESTDALSDILFSPALNPPIPHFQVTPDPISRSSTPGSEGTPRPRLFRNNSSPYRNTMFSESSGSGRTILADAVSTQREHLQSNTVGSHDGEAFVLVPDPAMINVAQARGDPTRQPCRPPSTLSLGSTNSRPTEAAAPPQIDGHSKQKSRESPFHIRRRLGILR